MLPPELIQLGVASVAVAVIWYLLKLVIDGKLFTSDSIKVRDDRILDLTKSVETLTSALKSSNDQSATVIALWKALQSAGEDE